jgi:hypothetical protein
VAAQRQRHRRRHRHELRLGDADVGALIQARVSYTDLNGTAESLLSAAAGPVLNVNDVPTGAPVVTGTPTEDQTLVADLSAIADADGLGAFTLQWLRDGVAIAGATGTSYTLGDADVGTRISVRVDFIDGQGTAETLTSATVGPVANVNDPLTGTPLIVGVAVEDSSLSVDTASLADADGLGTIALQWLRDGVAIAGAQGTNYTLGDADVGARISVRVDHVDARGTTESLWSAPSEPVANVNDAPVLADGAELLLSPIDEDDVSPAGQSVADVLAAMGAGAISDADSAALRGIAIHAMDGGNGRWQFSLDAGATWVDAGTVAADEALLLRDTDWLRLLPDGMNGTLARFEFQAWDQTSGLAGERVDATVAGGATALSVVSRGARLQVLDVNDAPAITSGGGQALVELSAAENTSTVMTLSAADVDLPAQALSWRVAGGADAAWFSLDTATGQLAWRQPADFEARADADGDNVFEVTVQVNDGAGGRDEQTIRVVLTDLNESPVLIMGAEVSVMERAANGTAVLQLQAMDVDAGDRWSFMLVDDADGRFGLDAGTGRVVVADGARLDAALDRTHTIVVRVTDAEGLSDERALRVQVAAQPVVPTPPAPGPVTPGPVTPVDPVSPIEPTQPETDPNEGRETATGNATKPVLEDSTIAGDSALRVDQSPIESARPNGSGLVAGGSSATARAQARDAAAAVSGVSFDFSPATLLDAAGQAASETFAAVSELIARSWSIGGSRGSAAESASEDGNDMGTQRESTLNGFVGGMMEPANVASVSVTAGFVWWLTRGGGMLATVLMGVPAWRHIDLLPVMARDLDDEDDEDKDDEDTPEDSDLDGMFDRRADKAPEGGRRG